MLLMDRFVDMIDQIWCNSSGMFMAFFSVYSSSLDHVPLLVHSFF